MIEEKSFSEEDGKLLTQVIGTVMDNLVLPYEQENEFVCNFIDKMVVGSEHNFYLGDKKVKLRKTAHVGYGNYNMRVTHKFDEIT